LFWLVFFISLLGFVFSFYKIVNNRKLRPILVLRGFLFIILIFLILDPKVEQTKSKSVDLKWHLYLDRSLSMSYHTQPSIGSLISGVDQIVDQIRQKKAEVNIIGFGNDLDTSWAVGDKMVTDGSTNMGLVIDHILASENNGIAGSIIITDGQANLGSEIPTQNLGISSPIHIIGVGDETPLVDISIHSIDAPPVIIKGENADIDVIIASHGTVNERLNVTIYSGKKLVGSKVVTVSGDGSLDRVRFRINPNQTGEIKYRVQVNVLSDEININNNKQVVPIQVLKNEYAVALITGAPNFNTQIIKQILSENPEYRIDHFVYLPDGYSQSLKTFWDMKYDLIIFDNHPIAENAKEWRSYLRIFAKKLVAHQTSLAFIVGADIHDSLLESYLSLMDVSVKDPLIELGAAYDWELNTNWDTFFPFHRINRLDVYRANLPPLIAQMEVDSSNAIPLANFAISEVNFPLFLVGEKPPLRFMVWSSPELNTLYYKTRGSELSGMTDEMFNTVFSWLMRTGNGQCFYFRSEKNSYQQGERVTITGKPIRDTETADDGFLHVSHQGKRINTKPIIFNENTGNYTGQFWASQSGQLDYEIELTFGNKVVTVGEGSVQVQESQVELNHVYLNKGPLMTLAEMNNGFFRHWDDRQSLISQISPESKIETLYSKIVLHDSWWMLILIFGILSAEWFLRRRLGLM
jgi:hypothetical protein